MKPLEAVARAVCDMYNDEKHSVGVRRLYFRDKIAHIGAIHWGEPSDHLIPRKKEIKCVFNHDARLENFATKPFTRPVEVKAGDELSFFVERGRYVARLYRNGRCITVRRTER